MKRIPISFCLLFLVLLFSCRKETEKPSWDTQDLAPLLKSSLSINNLLPDSILQENPDSSMKIVFKKDFFEFSTNRLFQIPDTSLLDSYSIPTAVTLQPGQPVVSNNLSETTYSLQGAQLRTVVIKSGFINYSIKSYIHEVTDFVYGLPSATKDGAPFTINISVPAAVGDTPGTYDQTFDLSGYVLNLTGINGNKINTIYTSLTALVSASGQPVLVNPGDSLIISNTFKEFTPYYANGYFGSTTIDIGPDETEFSMFKKVTDGSIQLEDVSFNLSIENPIGIDAQVYINSLNSINTNTGSTISLVNSEVGSPININRAVESAGIIYPTYENIPLNVSNSNIKQMLENLPDKFGYSIQMITNPLGNLSGSNDFIYSDSLLKVMMNMEIPLSMVANDLTLQDTIDFNLSGENNKQNINSGKITLIANNGFPFKASLQVYLLNDDSQIVDSLFANANTINEALIDANLRATDKTSTTLLIPLSEAKMNRLYATKKIILKLKFNTSNQPQYMKIYSDYEIDIKMIGDINYTIQLK